MNAERLTEKHLASSIEVFESRGAILPAAWAYGPYGSLVASPYRHDAVAAAIGSQITGVLVVLAATTGFQVVGRTDEAWVRATTPDELDDIGGTLNERADWDPHVRTAIVCHAIEIPTTRQALALAVETISDLGEREWLLETHEQPGGARAEALLYASAACQAHADVAPPEPPTLDVAARWLDALGWLVAPID